MSGNDTVHFIARWQHHIYEFTVPSSISVTTLYTHIAQYYKLNSNIKVLGIFKPGNKPDLSLQLNELKVIENQPVKLSIIGTLNTELQHIQHIDHVTALQQQYEQEQYNRLVEHDRLTEQQQIADRLKLVELEQQRRIERQKYMQHQQLLQPLQHDTDTKKWQLFDRYINHTRYKPELTIHFELNVQQYQLPVHHNNNSTADKLLPHDRIVLPSECLEQIVDSKVQLPLIFAVHRVGNSDGMNDDEKKDDAGTSTSTTTKDTDSLFSYLSVDSFTAPYRTAIVSKYVMQTLNLHNNDIIRIQNINVINASGIQLTVLTNEWIQLAELERKALLEQNLRLHQHLVINQEINITYTRYHNTYKLLVTKLEPCDVVSIVDSDVATDIVIPEHETKTNMNELIIDRDQPITGDIQSNQYINYMFNVTDTNRQIVIDLTCDNDDVDLYITSPAETSWIEPPTLQAYSYCNNVSAVSVNNRKQIILNNGGIDYIPGRYQLSVYGYNSSGRYTLSAKSIDYDKTNTMFNNNSTAPPSSSSSSSAETVTCGNCHRCISSKAIQMHELQCKRLNYYCIDCSHHNNVDPVINVKNKSKHMELYHQHVYCICGEQVEQISLINHRQYNCSQRLVHCQYCPLLVEQCNRGLHQQQCGLATSHCKVCNNGIQRKLLARHMDREHNIHSATWKDWF